MGKIVMSLVKERVLEVPNDDDAKFLDIEDILKELTTFDCVVVETKYLPVSRHDKLFVYVKYSELI